MSVKDAVSDPDAAIRAALALASSAAIVKMTAMVKKGDLHAIGVALSFHASGTDADALRVAAVKALQKSVKAGNLDAICLLSETKKRFGV